MRFRLVRHHVARAAACGIAFLPTAVRAREDAQIWTGVAATERLSDRWRLSQEAIVRFSSARGGRRVAGWPTFWAGYTHDPNYMAGRFSVMEHHGREQITVITIRIGPDMLNLRLQVEQRWREGGIGYWVSPSAFAQSDRIRSSDDGPARYRGGGLSAATRLRSRRARHARQCRLVYLELCILAPFEIGRTSGTVIEAHCKSWRETRAWAP